MYEGEENMGMTGKEIIRKLKHNLYISGIGVILLGVWGCLKATMTLYLSGDGLDTSGIEEEALPIYVGIVIAILLIINVIIMAFHLYVGLNAMKEGKKENKKIVYLFVAGFMGVLSLLTIAGDIAFIRDNISQIDLVIASFLVDFTFLFIIVDIIYSSVKIRKLEKQGNVKGVQ